MKTEMNPGCPYGAELTSRWLATASLYFLLAAATIHLTSDGRTIATVWPANAILVAMLLLGREPRWKTVLSAGLIANIAANWITRGTVAGPLLYSVSNGVEVVIAVTLIRADGDRLEFLRSTNRLLRFIAAAGVAAPLISGVLGAATAAAMYRQPFGPAFTTWLLSDGLGLLVFTPVFFSLFNGEFVECFASKTVRQRVEGLALLALTAAAAYGVFFVTELPALVILFAPVMLVTFRTGPQGTKMAVMIIALTGACATGMGLGPFTRIAGDVVGQAHLFQAWLAIMLLTCLPVAAEIAERQRLSSELATRERQAVEAAMTDPLTGLLNRRGFERAAAQMMARAGSGLSCVVIDVDRFKEINDRWGHQFGDQVLCHIASALRGNTRPGDTIGRLGGDEFVLLLRLDTGLPGEVVCDRIQGALRLSPISPDGQTLVPVSISCGVTAARTGDRFDDLYRRADVALYDAKVAGRNTVRLAASG